MDIIVFVVLGIIAVATPAAVYAAAHVQAWRQPHRLEPVDPQDAPQPLSVCSVARSDQDPIYLASLPRMATTHITVTGSRRCPNGRA
jgi:hypothetical protein